MATDIRASLKPAPPPTRGWTLLARAWHLHTAGSPAHAGMDPWRAGTPTRRNRLPRPRGDGPPAGQERSLIFEYVKVTLNNMAKESKPLLSASAARKQG